jgi:uncharacterized protein
MTQQAPPPVTAKLTRDSAYELVTKYLTNKNLLKHSLAAEAAMKAIYRKLYPMTQTVLALDGKTQIPDPIAEHKAKSEEEKWGIVGLLHDADYEMAKGKPEEHGLLLFTKETWIPTDIAHAIKSHNYQYTKVMPETKMDWAITCCDQLTGLIVACALVHPEKKLEPLTVDFITKRFRESSFAKGADRSTIELCHEKLGIPLPDFIEVTLSGMKTISAELEL